MEKEREIEIFDANRDYEELVEILDIERVEKIDVLPCDVTGADDDDIATLLTWL